MKLLELIFAIVSKFVPINPASLAQLESDGRQWELGLEKGEESSNFFAKMYMKVNKEWYWRLLWAVLYVPLCKYIQSNSRDE
ncbi:MAG: hypothetical protein ACYDEX_21975, partial [Mobilitalea sp.]